VLALATPPGIVCALFGSKAEPHAVVLTLDVFDDLPIAGGRRRRPSSSRGTHSGCRGIAGTQKQKVRLQLADCAEESGT
jgi:hypothetical protein